jgi:peroxiredoxin
MADSNVLWSWCPRSMVVGLMLASGCQRVAQEAGRVDEAIDHVAQEDAKSKAEGASTVCAEKVVRKLSAFMAAQKSFGCDVAVSMHVQANGQDSTMDSNFDLKFARPNRLAMIAGTGTFGLSIYSNGTEMTLDLPILKKYSVNPAPENFDDVKSLVTASPELAMVSEFNSVLFDLLAVDPAKPLLADLKQTKYIGEEEIDGAMCQHISVETANSAWEAWIDAGEQPVVRRFRPDMAKLMAQGGGPKGMQLEVTVNFKNWKLGDDYQEADFAFTPAEGEQKVASILGGEAGPEPLSPLVGEPAPEFKVALLDGHELELSKHLGKEVVILDFWATWCGPCVRALPMIIAATDKYRDKGVVLYAMNQREDADTIRPFLEQEKLDVTVALDADGKVGEQYGVEGIPQTVIIGKDGKVQVVHVGFSPNLKQRLLSELDDLLAGKDLATEAKEKSAAQAKEEPETSIEAAPSAIEE